jgi:hypothetical protein
MARLSALRAGRFLPPGKFLVLIFVRGWVDPRAIVWLKGLSKLKKKKKFTSSGTWTGDLPSCNMMPQPTTLPLAPQNKVCRIITSDIWNCLPGFRLFWTYTYLASIQKHLMSKWSHPNIRNLLGLTQANKQTLLSLHPPVWSVRCEIWPNALYRWVVQMNQPEVPFKLFGMTQFPVHY